ncbi:MAG: hypothetical protein L3J33_04625 [Rhodobacteraceae bacterium]|nr:hypothetical protein [Paracoccaceae bacterium]
MRQPPKSNPPRRLLAVQRLFGLLALIMMLFGQTISVGAVQGNTGMWIEICDGAGSKMVQLEDEMPQDDCAHCDLCKVQLTASYAGCAASGNFAPAYGLTGFQLCSGTEVFVTGAEQYWAASRGPPLGSETTFMLDYLSLASKESAISSPVLRGALWL